ncbi:MAG: TonB-dependent receptor [Bacteroidetes bacterium]|nr:TonB-dependent receptor [Bacteroidota bacterium]
MGYLGQFSWPPPLCFLQLNIQMGTNKKTAKKLFHLLLFFLCITASNSLYAQTGSSIRGKITNGEQGKAERVSVEIVELKQRTYTDINGYYHFPSVAPGNYTLSVKAERLPEKRFQVVVKPKEETAFNCDVSKISNSLGEIVVFGDRERMIRRESTTAARLPISNLENPQVSSVVSQQLLQQQVVTDLGEALTNIPGAGVPIAFNQNRLVVLSRGFYIQPKFRNGLAAFIQTSIDPVNVERIEAIKGPSSTLFGASEVSYGGLINRVTKKPYNGFGGEAAYSMGSWELNRLTLDVNAPVNRSKTLLLRVNAAGHSENSFQDAGFTKSFAFTPSLSYQVNSKLSVSLDLEHGINKGTSPVRFTPYTKGIVSQNIADMGIPYDRSFASNNMAYNSQATNIIAQANYHISEQWNSQTTISRTSSSFDGYTSQLSGRSATTLRAQVTVGKYEYYTTDIQQNFTGDFKLGNLRNRLLVGFDYYNYKAQRNTANVNTATVDFTQPLTTYYRTFNKYYVDSAAQTATAVNTTGRENTYGAYVSNVSNITSNLLVMLSLRLDRFENAGTYTLSTAATTGKYGQTALSPKLGVVYQLLSDRLSLFGNYLNGFTNQTGSDVNGNTFKPEQANQFEGGVKIDLFDHKLAGTISYYNIQVKDIVRNDPDNADYSIQNGTQESKGVEVDLAAQPLSGWQLFAGYAYNDSRYKQIDETLNGLRPAESGPAHQANFWTSYKMERGIFSGLGIGFGGNYGSKSYQTKTSTAEVIIPEYFVLNSTVFYKWKDFRLALKVNNITNEKYWSARLAPQKPFNVVGNVSINF